METNMKKFRLTLFSGSEAKLEKVVEVASKEKLKIEKNIFWHESHLSKSHPKHWMGVKRIR